MEFLKGYFQVCKSNLKKEKHFWKSNANVLYSSVNLHGIHTVCFVILIVSLNTTSSHLFMYTQSFHKMFNHGNLV